MPTTGKAAGAILFAALAFIVALIVVPRLPTFVPPGPARLVALGFGVLIGWRMSGDQRGSIGFAAARGVTAALVVALWTLLIGSIWQMLLRSFRGLYDDPMEALNGVASVMVDYGLVLLEPAPALVLILGGAVAGVAARAVAQRWS